MDTKGHLNSYIENGWKIFPLKANDKIPLTEHGFKDATNDRSIIETWCKENPDCNWGLATGEIIVVDIDPRHGGIENTLLFPDTLKVKTGSGGFHLYYKNPGYDIHNSAGKLGTGIDVRGIGGYVVIPPSIHPNGNQYEWMNDKKIETLPEELYQLMVEDKKEFFKLPVRIPEGERNNDLFKLGSSLRGKGFSEDEIQAALVVVNQRCETPLEEKELETIAQSASRYEPGVQFEEKTLTDLGNAERLVEKYGNVIRYCFDLGDWLIWNGKNWEQDKTEYIKTLAYEIAKGIYQEAASVKDTLQSRNLGDWAKSSLSSYRINNMIEMSKSLLPVSSKELDKNPYLVNLENGVLNLLSGELVPHNPEYFLTKIIHVNYEINTACKKWMEFLDLVLPDKELQKFVKKAVGYSLSGSTDAQVLFFLYGLGANGKSTFIETIRRLFGEYSQRADIEALLDTNRGGGANPYIARLFKTRYVVSTEIPEGKRINESLIKDLTGSDVLVARKLYQEPFEFEPTHKLWLVGNYKPNVQDMSLGFWRRMRVIPFKVTIPKEKQKDISIVLREFEEESSGILNWAVEGYLLYRQEGLIPPDAVQKATEEYKTEQDLFQQFIDEETEFGDFRVTKEEFSERLNSYLFKTGEKRNYSMNRITRELSTRGIEPGGKNKRFFIGIMLLAREPRVKSEIDERVESLFSGTLIPQMK